MNAFPPLSADIGLMAMLKKIFADGYRYRWLLEQLVGRDLKVKYKRSYLGYLWSLLNPLMMMAIVSIVFSEVFRYDIQYFPVYLLCGQIIFSFFSEATTMAMNSILQNAGLLKKVAVPKYILPLSKLCSSGVNLLWSLAAIAIMFCIQHVPWHATMLLFPIPLLLLFLLSYGVGLMMAVLATQFRDMAYLYGVLMQALMYMTPIFYPVEALPPEALAIIRFNPLFHLVTYFRKVVLYGRIPDVREHIVCIAFAVGFYVMGRTIFQAHQKNFVLYI